MTDSQVRLSTIAFSTNPTHKRQTVKSDFGTVLKTGIERAGNAVLEGAQAALPFLPGRSILSAAISGGRAASLAPRYAASGGVSGVGVGVGGGGGIYGSSSLGVTSGSHTAGTGVAGSYGADGNLVLPGHSPGLGTSIDGSYGSGVGGVGGAGSQDSFNQMLQATRNMTEFQASFNLQYLDIQQKIQEDTRQFNLISNIMKAKGDAAKNAITNMR